MSKDIASWVSAHTEKTTTSTSSSENAPVSATRSSARAEADDLGEPLGIKEVAHLLGCSPWSVRQSLIPRGLPYFRARANGRLVFFRQQVVRWVLRTQRTQGERR